MGVLFVQYPKCSTCKKAAKWLDEHGIDYTSRHIVENPPTAEELALWHGASGLPLRRFFNTSGMKYRELNVKAQLDEGMSDEDAYRLLASDGMLVKRPCLWETASSCAGSRKPPGKRPCSKRLRGRICPMGGRGCVFCFGLVKNPVGIMRTLGKAVP